MFSERRVTRSQSVQPSRLPRARRASNLNTLSAPVAEGGVGTSGSMNEDQNQIGGSYDQEGVSNGLESRIIEIEKNLTTLIETQLSNTLQKLMNNYIMKEKDNQRNLEVDLMKEKSEVEFERDQDEEESRESRGKARNFKVPKVKIEPRLNGPANFTHWKMMVEGQMKATRIHFAIKEKLDEDDELNIIALDFITRSVGAQMFPHILDSKTAYDAWRRLENYCAPKNATEIRRLRKEFGNIKMKDNNVDDYITKFKGLQSQLAHQGVLIPEEELIAHLLGGLSEKYENVAIMVESSTDRIDEACSKLRLMINRMRNGSGQNVQNGGALMMKGKSKKDVKCYKCGKTGHIKPNCKEEIKCYNCNKTGHVSKECKAKEKEQKEVGLVSGARGSCGGTIQSEWVLDSGASSHICSRLQCFQDTEECNKCLDQLETNRSLRAFRKGTIMVDEMILKDVLYVPNANVNLISLNKMLKDGYKVNLLEDRATLLKEGKQIIFNFTDGLYKLKIEQFFTSSERIDDLNLWHRRFGHANKKLIKFMHSKKMVDGLEISNGYDHELCNPCIIGKMKREKFDIQNRRSVQNLDVIHSDICGPFPISLGGKSYYVALIDENSRFRWIYLMERRDELFTILKKFILMIKTQFHITIKILRSDNGGEYISYQLAELLSENGILHERTVPYSPQMNGIAERFNRTLLDSVRSMLDDSKLPKIFWGEAAATAVYVLNRSFTSILKDKTPYEALMGSKPIVSHLRVFGSKCWFKVVDQKRKKLDDKAEEGIFLGYISDSIYRVYSIKTREVIRTREIVVEETSTVSLIEKNQDNDDEEVIVVRKDDEDVVVHEERLFVAWDGSPQTYLEAREDENSRHWNKAMEDEYNSLIKNETWVLVPRPEGKNVVSGKWVYVTKRDEAGKIIRYKARWVARGFNQIKGVDYNEVFAPTARSTTIRILLSIIVGRNMFASQYDVETAYLNGIVKEEVYLEQPTGFEVGDKVCKLKKAIYGLKQAGREWNSIISKFFEERNFRASESDPCLFVRWREKCLTIIVLYVDDLIIASDSKQEIAELELDLKREYKIKELGSLNFYLGIKIKRDDTNIVLSQEAYRHKVLTKFQQYRYGKGRAPISKILEKGQEEESSRSNDYPYQQILGSLMYMSTSTRPDITFAISFLSRRMKNPQKCDELMLSGVLKYLEETGDLQLNYTRKDDLESGEVEILLYTDSDWGGDRDDCASTSGYLCFLNGNLISWRSKKQDRVAMSSTEAEYISLFHGIQEAIWVKQLLEELKLKIKDDHVKVYADNKGAINLAENAVYSPRTKHIDLKYHFSRQAVARGDIKITYINTDDMKADGLTKPIGGLKLDKFFAGVKLMKSES